jgi:hypothetical protein
MNATMMWCGKGSRSPLHVKNVGTGCPITFSNAGSVDSKLAMTAEDIDSNRGGEGAVKGFIGI